ncbi:RNA polymerase sigma factor [Tenacibaculum tangerinum]|uniref:RNA polymerase sigma factor n=1 Tax=Tenacibaculum tangerinum TaxID=3038772 RepID=A0ABY8L0E9_9FLAO|nr:RNA polymerase sigma factor [Tenacibaculum tangerinum]WGH74951.1 RNA polymerase sigma factor [Tenacibaculum tangerinum]
MDLERLIYLCKKRDLKAQAILYKEYKDFLFVLSLKYCKNREEAQDNIQDAFIEIFKSIHKFKDKGSFEGWMKRITINKAIDKYKKSIKTNTIIHEHNLSEDIEVTNIDETPLPTILKFIQELPNQYRLVFNLYELDDYSHKEISKLLLISVGTSKSNLFRAKQILKSKIEEYRKLQ